MIDHIRSRHRIRIGGSTNALACEMLVAEVQNLNADLQALTSGPTQNNLRIRTVEDTFPLYEEVWNA